MMRVTDDTLMAYADGELDAAQRAEIEQALAADAPLRERVTVMSAQRHRLAAAFAPVLDEPAPDRLSALLKPPAPAPVVDLGAVRAARRGMASWAAWGGMAASVVLGMLVGLQVGRPAADPGLALRDGQLVAEGPIARALSSQLASEPATASKAGAAVAVQLSFVDTTGSYCRTFSIAASAGLACRDGAQWKVQALAATEPPAAGTVRQAGSALPRAVLDAVDQRIGANTALDPAREREARDRGWRSSP